MVLRKNVVLGYSRLKNCGEGYKAKILQFELKERDDALEYTMEDAIVTIIIKLYISEVFCHMLLIILSSYTIVGLISHGSAQDSFHLEDFHSHYCGAFVALEGFRDGSSSRPG